MWSDGIKEDDFTESAMWQQLQFNDFLNSLWEERKPCCILSEMSPRSKIREVILKHLTFPLKNKECLNCMLCLKVSVPSHSPLPHDSASFYFLYLVLPLYDLVLYFFWMTMKVIENIDWQYS